MDVFATSIGGTFQGIDGVERKPRTRNVVRHEVTSETLESDPNPNKYPSVNPLAQDGQSRFADKQTSNKINWRTNHDSDNGQRAFPVKLIKIIQDVRQEVSPEPTPPKFVFELTEEAFAKNFIILNK